MEANPLAIKLGNCLYHHFFPLYKLLYPVFKKRQDAVEIAWMRRLVSPGSHALDIGANIGFYTSLLSDLVGSGGHVYAFEPEPTNFKHLSAIAGDRQNVTLVAKAVSDRSENLTIYTSPNLNVDHRAYKVANYELEIPVQAVSIDDYVGGRFPVKFIKMDIQGFELPAFRGMERTVIANAAMVIFSEFWPYGFRQCGTSASIVYNYIRSLNLQMWLPERDKLRPVSRTIVDQFSESETAYYNVILSRTALA
jgi:FkbM family methyltransferase